MKKYKLLLLIFMTPFMLYAQTWEGDVSTDWNTAGNWSTNSVPTNIQIATFNGTATTNCVISGNIPIGGINIVAAFTGTISIADGGTLTIGNQNYNQLGGTFNCGTGTFVCSNNTTFNHDGGTFISSSNTITLGGDVDFFSGGFNANGGTIIFNSESTAGITVDGNNNAEVTLNTVIINMPTPNQPTNNYLLGSSSTLLIQGDLTIARGCFNGTVPGRVRLLGNFTMGQTGTSGNLTSNVDIEFIGNTNTIIALAPGGETLYNGGLTLNKTNASNTVTLNSPMILNNQTNSEIIFSMGKLVTTQANSLTIDGNNIELSVASDNSFIDGPMIKIAESGNSGFAFPIGDNDKYAPLVISGANNSIINFGGSAAHSFRAEYFRADPDPNFDVDSKDASLTNIGRCEYWVLDRLADPSVNANPFVWLSYDNVRSCGISMPADLRVARWNGTLWNDMGNVSTTNNGINFVSTSSIVSTFSPFNLASIDPITNPLPITLLNFSGYFRDGILHLKWTTAFESNSSYFLIERSTDGRNFNDIGQVSARGNTVSNSNYQFTDVAPAIQKINYYRLKQVDIDNKFTYSPVIRINTDKANSFKASIIPNPATSVINLVIEDVKDKEELLLQLINTNGMIVHSERILSTGTTMIKTIQRPAVNAGLYFYRISRSSDEEIINGKLILQ